MHDSTPTGAHLTRGYCIAFISAFILSTTAIFIRHLTLNYHMPTMILAFWRDFFVVITLLPVLSIINPRLLRIEARQVPFFAAYGLILASFNALWTISVALNGAAISTVLVYCSAGFTVLLGWWLLNERLSWGKIVAMVLSIGGCVLVAGAWNLSVWRTNVVGLVTGVVSGLGYAAYSLMGRRASQRGINPWTTLLYTFSFATIYLLLFNLLPGELLSGVASRLADFLWLGSSLTGWGVLFALAAGPTIAGYGLYNVSLSYLPSSVANLIVTLEPAITAAIAFVLLGERFTLVQVGGSVMIMAGVVFLRVYEGWMTSQRTPRQEFEIEPAIAS